MYMLLPIIYTGVYIYGRLDDAYVAMVEIGDPLLRRDAVGYFIGKVISVGMRADMRADHARARTHCY